MNGTTFSIQTAIVGQLITLTGREIAAIKNTGRVTEGANDSGNFYTYVALGSTFTLCDKRDDEAYLMSMLTPANRAKIREVAFTVTEREIEDEHGNVGKTRNLQFSHYLMNDEAVAFAKADAEIAKYAPKVASAEDIMARIDEKLTAKFAAFEAANNVKAEAEA